jgi:hypothetical protein
MPPPRPMTIAEEKRFRATFPRLNVKRAVVTDNASAIYNCISWTIGVTTRWIWPGPTLSDFDHFYHGLGFVRSSNGQIAVWGHSHSTMTHGCVSGPSHGSRWESKCGSDLRIQHGLNELVGASYGRVVAFYVNSSSTGSGTRTQLEGIKTMEEQDMIQLQGSEATTLQEAVGNIDLHPTGIRSKVHRLAVYMDGASYRTSF